MFDYRRILIELVSAFLISVLMILILRDEDSPVAHQARGVTFSAIVLVLLCEGIFIFDAIISKRFPWHEAIRKRMASLFIFAMTWLAVIGFFAKLIAAYFFVPVGHEPEPERINVAITIYILFAIIYVIVLIGHNFHVTLNRYIVENERLNRQKLELDYSALQDQINPHFLFNNLSTLMALIRQDADAAVKFAGDFTDVYRYVLMSSRHKTITLSEELEFIRAYLGLHGQRLGDGLLVGIHVDEAYLSSKVPPLCLQFLVENAIKHNVATSAKPLQIDITVEGDKLCVTNNLQRKSSTYSTNTGLANLSRRYAFLDSNAGVEVDSGTDYFKVKVPML